MREVLRERGEREREREDKGIKNEAEKKNETEGENIRDAETDNRRKDRRARGP